MPKFAGRWFNVVGETSGTTKLIIAENAGKWTIRGYVKCHPQDCDWGTVPLAILTEQTPKSLGKSFYGYARWKMDFADLHILVHLEGDILFVELHDIYRDDPERENTRRVERFKLPK